MINYPLETCGCLRLGLACLGTIDANYAFSSPDTFGGTADDFTVVVGVNHTQTGKATYTNLTIYDKATDASAGSASDTQMAGSVDSYLPYVAPGKRALVAQYRQYLYVHKFARTCDNADGYCTVVPTSGVAGTYIAAGGTFKLVERAYLNPRGRYGPAFFEVLPPYVITSEALRK